AGVEILHGIEELGVVGFFEVLSHLKVIGRVYWMLRRLLARGEVDLLILIDYPGFNLRMATWAKKQGIRVFYYISPQLWAWHTSRVNIVRDSVERMFVIFPFEEEFYRRHGVEATFTGHPLAGVAENHRVRPDFFSKNDLETSRPIIAPLPGSRRQEVSRMLEVMLQTTSFFPDYQFVIAGAPSLERAFYEPFLSAFPTVKFVGNQTYDLLQHARAALVTSGTATLETALFEVPQVVCYRGGSISYRLATWLVNKDLKFISIVNLIAGRQVVAELVQHDFTVENLVAQLEFLRSQKGRDEVLAGYREVKALLGPPGAAKRTAEHIVKALFKTED
ncbi:MAG: lipid-A-disaccharide synthase, partial [Bacteroidetes bacterium]|nr:lipid-A-disaccharide synthase [Bacteroidota bacterium]